MNTAVTINELSNDTDAEGDTLTITADTAGTNGPPSINGNTVTFTPASNFSGTATFNYTVSDSFDTDTGTVTVTVNPGGTIHFSSPTYSVTESGGSAVVTITRTGGSTGATSVQFSTSNGTAGAADYTTTNTTVNFADGQTSQTVNVPIINDTANEPDETINLALSNVTGTGQLGTQATATLTILNDDSPGVQFSSASHSINEGATNTPQGFASLTIDVIRTGDSSQAATVRYITSDNSGGNECNHVTGQASQRCDYILVGDTLRFAAGETSKTIQIPIINDGYQEGNEFFQIELLNGVGVTVGSPSQAIITIQDDAADSTPTTSANNPYLSNEFFVRQNYLDFLGRDAD